MKIKVVYQKSTDGITSSMNSFMEDIISKGYMIIDYGIDNDEKGICGYIKYCDKQFLRDYKIRSIMNEL